jgi:hypothetical protein
VTAIVALRAAVLFASLVCGAAVAAVPGERREIDKDGFRFAIGPVPAWVERPVVPDRWPSRFEGGATAWRYWLIDTQSDRRAGRRDRYIEEIYEPLSAELLDEAAQYTISFEPSYQELVIHRIAVLRDGMVQDRLDPQRITLTRRESQFEARQLDGRVSALVVLEDVRVGDRVQVAYTLEGGNPVMAGLDDERVSLQWSDPIAHRHVRVLADPGVELAHRVPPGTPKPRVRRGEDATELVLSLSQLAALVNEDEAPNWHPVFPEIVVTEQRGWRDVVAWALPLYASPDVFSPELEARIAKWKAMAPEAARALAALRFVQDDIRYFAVSMGDSSHRPNPPDVVLARRYGDCKDKTRLLVAIYRALGIDAHPALVSIRSGRGIADAPPSAGVFDHVIVAARIDGETWWLDPTASQQRGALGDLGATPFGRALPVTSDAEGLVEVVHGERGRSSSRTVETLTPGAGASDAELEVAFEWRGAVAESVRRARLQIGETRFADFLFERYAKRFAGVERLGSLDVADTPEGNGLSARMRLKVSGFWRGAGPGAMTSWFAALDIAEQSELPKVTVARRTPLALIHPNDVEHRFVIDPPRGWSASTLGGDLAIETPGYTYARRIEGSRSRVEISHRITSRADHVPADALARHFDGLRQINLASAVQVSLRGRGLSDGDRENRMRRLLDGLLDEPAGEPKPGGGSQP